MRAEHAEVAVKGFTVLTKTGKVQHIRVTCACGQTFEHEARDRAFALHQAHVEAQGRMV